MRRCVCVVLTALLSKSAFAQAREPSLDDRFAHFGYDYHVTDHGDGTATIEWVGGGRDRIWGGSVVPSTQHKAVVGLLAYQGGYGGVFCSGTLVNSRWVVTAGHCVEAIQEDYGSGYQFYAMFSNDVYNDNWNGIEIPFNTVVLHENYSFDNYGPKDDIGLCKLAASSSVQVAVVNDENPNDFVGDYMTFVGYGVTTDGGDDEGVKRQTRIQLQYCESEDGYYGTCTPSSGYYPKILYSETAGTNVCQGDSGGAAFEELGSGRYELAGVNSYVTPQCVNGGNGAFRVDWYISWMQGKGVTLTKDWSDTDTDTDADSDTDVDTDTDTDVDTDADTDSDNPDTGWDDPQRPPEDAYENGFLGLCATQTASPAGASWLAALAGVLSLVRRRRVG